MKQRSVTTLKTVTAAVALALGSTMLAGNVVLDTGTAVAAQGSGGENAGGQGSGGQGGSDRQGGGAGQGQQGGGQGGSSQVPEGISAEDEDGEDSDKPEWAGGNPDLNPNRPAGGGKPDSAGTMKGDLYGDLWVILRDENGVPILSDEGFPQPIDEDGNLIPLDEEGAPVDETLVQEVELGRLNVGRSPDKVTDRAYDEAIAALNSAIDVELDQAGRIVVTLADGTEKTIDSPIENLALYTTLMTEGYLPGLEDNEVLGDLDFLKSGSDLTNDDLDVAASLLAAGADKFGTLNIDQVAYLNSILGIAEMTSEDYVDYSTFDYNRDATYTGDITYYVQQADGSIVQVTEPILDAVFGGESYTSSDGIAITDFSTAADDALQMIEFVHENIPFE